MILEREAELSELTGALRQGGTTLLIEGEPGIGKSTLLQAARRAAGDAGVVALSARATVLETELAFGVTRQLLTPATAQDPSLLTGAAALAAPVLSDDPPAGPPGLEAPFAALHGLIWTVSALVERDGPLAILVDDLQWADPPSLRLLHALAVRADELNIVLIAAARPLATSEAPQLALEFRNAARVIRPQRLSPDGVGTALNEALEVQPDQAFAQAAHQATAGTPFLVVTLARALKRDGVTPDATHLDAIATAGAAEIGADVGRRLTGLAPQAVTLARAIAVLGDGRPAAEALQLAQAAPDALDALSAVGLIDDTERPAYAHALIRSAVLDGLSAADRARLHDGAAQICLQAGETDRAAAHLHQTPGSADPQAVAALRAVARRAAGRGAPDVAAVHLRRALSEPPDDPGTALTELALAEAAANDPQAPDRLQAAAAHTDIPDLKLRLGLIRGHSLTFLGDLRAGTKAMIEALDAAGDASPGGRLIGRMELASWLRTCHSTAAQAHAIEESLRDEPIEDGFLAALRDGVVALYDSISGEPRDAVLARCASALRDGPPVNPRTPAAMSPLFALVQVDAFDEADRVISAVVDSAHRRGDLVMVRVMGAWRALSETRRGHLQEAEEALLAAEEGGTPIPLIGRLIARTVTAVLAVERGDLVKARACFADDLDLDPAVEDIAFTDGYLTARGRLELAEGDAEKALQTLLRVGARQTAYGAASAPVTQWRTQAVEAYAVLGRHGEGRTLATEEVAAARRFGAPRILAMALRAHALVAHPEEKDALFAEAIEQAQAAGSDLELARTLLDRGRLATRAETDRREDLRQALDRAWHCGADALAERARTELVAAGGRPRRDALTGLRALTAAEARTARMAAQGLSNREIAEQLFVTRKTVELHLTSTYRKLGIAGRAELEDAI